MPARMIQIFRRRVDNLPAQYATGIAHTLPAGCHRRWIHYERNPMRPLYFTLKISDECLLLLRIQNVARGEQREATSHHSGEGCPSGGPSLFLMPFE